MSVCLCMIVRDEAAVIERCLKSALPHISSYCIVDTGSTDDTKAIIDATLPDDMPGRLYDRTWVDFGHNRTELLRLAAENAASLNADYLLLLDADWTIEGEIPEQLSADSYLVKHVGEPEFWNVRLVSAKKAWRYEGAVHEYITADEPRTRERLESLTIRNHSDGGSRQGRHERDIGVLTGAIDARALFYLAQSYRDTGRASEAAVLYRARALLGGFDEEVFYALLQAGILDGDETLLGRALELRPHRPEPYHALAERANRAGRHHAAAAWARAGLTADGGADILFIERWQHDWGLRFELSIAVWYKGLHHLARDLSERLLAREDLPAHIREQVERNLQFSPVG